MMSAKSPIVPFVPANRRRRPVVSETAGADFSDPESQRVLAAAAQAVARELGREAAREYFAELLGQPKVS
jgi:hypothetical protein